MPTTTTYGVDLIVELGIGQAAAAGHWGTGLWGTDRWGESDTSLGDWVDVTCDVLDDVRLTAGSNTDAGVSRRWESASCSFTLDGPVWDPWNGPHADVVGDRTPVRISWRPAPDQPWIPTFSGYIATRGYSWDADESQAQVACVDGTSILVASDGLPRPSAGAGESAAQRVARIATVALWPAGTDITAGGTALQATTMDTVAWEELLQVADTDLALLWVDRAGALAYRPRGRVGQGTRLSGRLAVCPVTPTDVQVMTLGRNQPSVTRNRIAIARKIDDTVPDDEPGVVQLEDPQSVARFQAHDFKRTDLWHTDDGWSATIAQAVLGAGAWPSPAPGEILLDSITADPRVGPLLLTLEVDMTFDVVDDTGRVWREAIVGWDVQVSHAGIEGVLHVEDVTRWSGVGHWGTAIWGADRWGIGGT